MHVLKAKEITSLQLGAFEPLLRKFKMALPPSLLNLLSLYKMDTNPRRYNVECRMYNVLISDTKSPKTQVLNKHNTHNLNESISHTEP